MIILLVGPSGIGKSTAIKGIKNRLPDFICDSMDSFAHRWARLFGLCGEADDLQVLRRKVRQSNDDPFLMAGLAATSWLASQHFGKHLLIDVGAGFIAAPRASSLHKCFPVVCLSASPEVAFERRKREQPGRPQGEFLQAEFNAHRQMVYSTAHHKIDTTTLSETEVVDGLANVLSTIIS